MGLRDELLAKIDVLAEYEAIGLRVAKGARPNAEGWLSCHALGREDNNPSASINIGPNLKVKGIYKDFVNGLAMGLFNAVGGHGDYADGTHCYREMLTKYGFSVGNGKNKTPPTLTDVKRYRENLSPEIIQYLKDKRGLTDESIAKFEIGWDVGRERNTIPVYVPGGIGKTLVNIRMHNCKKTPKTLNWAGSGAARLYGADRLVAAPPGSTVIITEGEFDCMLAEQETGYIGVSPTNGAKTFQEDWVKLFHGHHVVAVYDCDKEGREAVAGLVLPVFQKAVESGQVLSIKAIWLYPGSDKAHKDVTDWITKDGGSGEELKKNIADTPAYIYPTSTIHLEDPIELKSFTEVDRSEYAGKRVTVNLQVYGENTVAYYGPQKVRVTDCQALKEGKCFGNKDPNTNQPGNRCMHDIQVPLGERILISGVRATEGQFKSHIQAFICEKDRRPAFKLDDTDRVVVREVFAHQIFEAMKFSLEHQIDKPVYILGGAMVGIGKYQATGRIVSSYKDQQPVLLVDRLVHQDEDYQCFDLDTARPHLQKLQNMMIEEICDDLSCHVTRIYQRWDLHLGVLLVLCTPLWFNFPGEGRIRGWLTAIMVGDSGTGKTSISQGLFEFAGVGDRVSGLTASRTGITYGLEHDERKGWRVRAGALLKQSRQALIVDEAQDLPEQELKTMAEGIDTGTVKIDRIQQRTFESATRVIFSCNPKDPKRAADQKKMDDFRFGCHSVEDLFVTMMLRRIDLCLFASSGDIEDKEEIFNPPEDMGDQQVMADDLRAMIFWAWNLQEDQIVISPAVGGFIRRKSLELSKVFGCDKPPIVYPEDFRKTLARLSVAYAVLDVSVNEDFTQVIVANTHVKAAAQFIDIIYRAENCALDKHAATYRQSYSLENLEEIRKEIDEILSWEDARTNRFIRIVVQLLKTRLTDRLRKSDLEAEFDVQKKTIQRDMNFFVKHRLVKSNIQTGYSPEPRLFKVFGRLQKINPEKYKFDDAPLLDDDEGASS